MRNRPTLSFQCVEVMGAGGLCDVLPPLLHLGGVKTGGSEVMPRTSSQIPR